MLIGLTIQMYIQNRITGLKWPVDTTEMLVDDRFDNTNVYSKQNTRMWLKMINRYDDMFDNTNANVYS